MQVPARSKGWLIGGWAVSAVSFVITVPIAFIAGVFASDDATSTTVWVSYVLIASPILLLVLPIVSQISYARAKLRASEVLSILAIVFSGFVLGYLGYVLFIQ